MPGTGLALRSCRELWNIVLGRSALREEEQIKDELDKHFERLEQGLAFFKVPSNASAQKLQADKEADESLKGFSVKLSEFLGLDELQSFELLHNFLQEDYRAAQEQLKAVLEDERHSQALMVKVREYYFEERLSLLRCVLHLLTFFQDERHPYRAVYADCLERLQQSLTSRHVEQLEERLGFRSSLCHFHGNMAERQAACWAQQCLREQCLLLELLFLYYVYFEMKPHALLRLARLFHAQSFGLRQLQGLEAPHEGSAMLVSRVGYFCALLLIEGMDIEFLAKCAQGDCVEQHQLVKDEAVFKELDQLLQSLGDLEIHGPVLLAWAMLRYKALPDDPKSATRRLGRSAVQLQAFRLVGRLLRAPGFSGSGCTSSTARAVVYGLLSFVLGLFDEGTLGEPQDLMDVACEVLSMPALAEAFWDAGLAGGLAMLLDSAAAQFPYACAPLLQLLTATVVSQATAKRVYNFLDKMTCYAEAVPQRPRDIEASEDGTMWRTTAPRHLYPFGAGRTTMRLPQGVVGRVLPLGPSAPGGPSALVHWEFGYSAWALFACEVEMLLHVVSTADVARHCDRVRPIVQLVRQLLDADGSLAAPLLPVTSRLYMALQRLTCVPSPPLDVIAACVNCLAALVPYGAAKVWSDVQHTGLLPFTVAPVSNAARAASGEGMHAGNYGNLLVGFERHQGDFRVTASYLRLITALLKGLVGRSQYPSLLPCLVFTLKEILARYRTWALGGADGHRECIGKLMLEQIHFVLNISGDSGRGPSLQAVCLHSLLHGESGLALIHMLSIGVGAIDTVLAAQPGRVLEGPALTLIQTMKLAFSVINNTLRLKPASEELTPLEHALTQQGVHGNVMAILARYIYHRHDAALPRLAVQLLKRLAMVAPMSVYGCLGGDAPAIRDAFIGRLRSPTEDMRIKVMILEFLTVAVETQPGLIELFLDLQPESGADSGSKELALGSGSCLPVVLELVCVEGPGAPSCPPLLHRTAVAFVYALWQDRRQSAMTILRSRKDFWENLTYPLFSDFLPISTDIEVSTLEACAFILKIISLEVFYVVSGSLDPSLVLVLRRLNEGGRYRYWSGYVRGLACRLASRAQLGDGDQDVGGGGGAGYAAAPEAAEDGTNLVEAWRTLLILATNHGNILFLDDDETRATVMQDVLAGLSVLVKVECSRLCVHLMAMLSTTLCVLLRHWGSALPGGQDVLAELLDVLRQLQQATERRLAEKIRARLLAAVMLVLQQRRLRAGPLPGHKQLVQLVCETLRQEVTALMEQSHSSWRAAAAAAPQASALGVDSMDTDSAPAPARDDRDGVCVVALHLAKELYLLEEGTGGGGGGGGGSGYLSCVREGALLPAVGAALEWSLQRRCQLHFTEAALHWLLALSTTVEGAQALAAVGVLQCLCLPLLSTYQVDANGLAALEKAGGPPRRSHEAPSWQGAYCLCLAVLQAVLRQLRHSALPQALDFLGVHQERILQSLQAVRGVQGQASLEEAEKTVAFLLHLAYFTREWHFHLPLLLNSVQAALCSLCQTCTALLHSQKLLQQYLASRSAGLAAAPGRDGGGRGGRGAGAGDGAGAAGGGTGEVGQEAERGPGGVALARASLLRILGITLAALRRFSPDVCQILLDQTMDLSEYEPLFSLSLVAPSCDADARPSLGSLLSAISVAQGLAAQADGKRELAKHTSAGDLKALKPTLVFVMENALALLMSQAMLYLKHCTVSCRDKQRIKRELSSELEALQNGMLRWVRRGSPVSPGGGGGGGGSGGGGGGGAAATGVASGTSAGVSLQAKGGGGGGVGRATARSAGAAGGVADAWEHAFHDLVDLFLKRVLR
ncbi:nucleoporin NUP188 isoform X3 [Petromyzon marinus]|uniref:nucleoporin NUP188 isoform X3 n=1 Tax=Petromyzon marinus TaxID=7757 RepID=UPI003F6FE60C